MVADNSDMETVDRTINNPMYVINRDIEFKDEGKDDISILVCDNVAHFYVFADDLRKHGFQVLPLSNNPVDIGPHVDSGAVYGTLESARASGMEFLSTGRIRKGDYESNLIKE